MSDLYYQFLLSGLTPGVLSGYGSAQMQAALAQQQAAAQNAAAQQAYAFQVSQRAAAATAKADASVVTIDGEYEEIEAVPLLTGPPA